jgi:hypothetical protein
VNAAQTAVAFLIGVLVAAAVVLIIFDETVSGWVFGGFALLGFLLLLGMIANDRRQT